MDKVVASAREIIADIGSGSSLAVGGFGLCGVPSVLISALLESGVRELEVVSNNCGVDGWGWASCSLTRQIRRRIVSSYVGENKEFARQYLAGELEVELTPQGTLAEQLRAGGSGIGVLHCYGRGTQVADGGLPWRYGDDGSVVLASPAKETRTFATLDGEKALSWSAHSSATSAWSGRGVVTGTATDLSRLGTQLQPDGGHGEQDHDRRGGGAGRSR